MHGEWNLVREVERVVGRVHTDRRWNTICGTACARGAVHLPAAADISAPPAGFLLLDHPLWCGNVEGTIEPVRLMREFADVLRPISVRRRPHAHRLWRMRMLGVRRHGS